MKSILVALTLTLAGCEGPEIRKPTPPTTLQACVRPTGVTLTTFQGDGALKWTPEMEDGSVGIRYCDDDQYRVVEVTGLQAGLEKNHQAGWAVDAHNQVVTIDDLEDAISTTPMPTHRLVGVMVQCVVLPGSSCEPAEAAPPPSPGT